MNLKAGTKARRAALLGLGRAPPRHPDAVIDWVLDALLYVAGSLGAIALLASLARGIVGGWHLRHAIHFLVYGAILAGLVAGRRIPRAGRIAILLTPIGVNALANLYWFGLAGNGLLVLSAFCVLATVLAGRRAAILGLVGGAVAVLLVGGGVQAGLIPIISNPEQHLRSTGEWVAYGTVFLVFTVALILSVDAVQSALLRSARSLRQRSEQLEITNAELEREVEERRNVERELAEREAKYRFLAEATRDVIFTQDMNLRVTYVSPAAQAVFGYPPEEFESLTMTELVTAESLARLEESFAELSQLAARNEVQVPLMEYEYVRKDGSTFWGELHATFTLDEQGTPVGVQGILRDIDERRRAEAARQALEQQLVQSEKLQSIGMLAGGVAHDFNNQLSGILGYADLLRLECGDDPRVREYADRIAAPAHRAADLTAKLLAFARKGQYQLGPVDVHALVHEVVSILQRSISKTIRVRLELSAARTVVTGDATQLQNALLNIALNARDAMPKGGDLTFRTSVAEAQSSDQATVPSESGPHLVLEVHDTGLGMNEEAKHRAFEPFFTTKAPGEGTGMGLAAVYGTIRSHGGTVRVKSAPDHGTTLIVSLPLAAETAAAIGGRGPQPIERGTGRILVVDDEETVRQMTARMLRMLGYDAVTCESGPKALELFQKQWRELDLVLLDLVLPELDGRAVFEAMRQIDPAARIVLFSGYSATGDARAMLERGALGFLQKPFNAMQLSETVGAALTSSPESPTRKDEATVPAPPAVRVRA